MSDINQFSPSKYQQDVFDFIETGVGNAVISAVAGSGKTTTIVNALRLIPETRKILFLAFNKHIVEELKPRVPNYVEVSTLHSLGWRTLLSRYRGAKLDDKKLSKIFWNDKKDEWELQKYSRVFKQNKIRLYDYANTIIKLVNLIKLTNSSSEAGIKELMKKYMIPTITGMEPVHAKELFHSSITSKDTFDFSDMLYVPLREDLFGPTYDFVFVDEAQDLNRLQIQIARKILKKTSGRLIAVGDPYQSIYGFAGADPESFNILKSGDNTQELPLSICYRCAKNIVKFAQRIVPHIQDCETQIDGKVVESSNLTPDTGDWVISRNNSPLVTLYFQLLKEGKQVTIKGKDIGADLLSDIDSIDPIVPKDLFSHYQMQISRIEHTISNTSSDDAQLLAQLYNQIETISERKRIFTSVLTSIKEEEPLSKKMIDSSYLEKMKDSIQTMFSDTLSGIILSTAHKSKGLEADTVYIIRPDLFPSKFAKLPWQRQQETNLMYVAITRAKKNLFIVPKTNWDDTKSST
jgi:DNA helicase-2/ATP-dependent DNA helicase PcrA